MNIRKKLLVSVAAIMFASTSVAAQETPTAGGSGGEIATWASMPVGSHIMFGGLIFIVTIAGLVLLDDDEKTPTEEVVLPPPPPPTTTTTTTASS